MKYIDETVKFYNDVKGELRKVVWPKRKNLIGGTAAVFIVVIVITVILGIMDWSFTKIMKIFL